MKFAIEINIAGQCQDVGLIILDLPIPELDVTVNEVVIIPKSVYQNFFISANPVLCPVKLFGLSDEK